MNMNFLVSYSYIPAHWISLCLSVYHPVACSFCRSEGMMGFRYRCQQCFNYQLCQNCFWRGHASGNHNNQHEMKEHSSWVRISYSAHLLLFIYSNYIYICVCVCTKNSHKLVFHVTFHHLGTWKKKTIVGVNTIIKAFFIKCTFLLYYSKVWGRCDLKKKFLMLTKAAFI